MRRRAYYKMPALPKKIADAGKKAVRYFDKVNASDIGKIEPYVSSRFGFVDVMDGVKNVKSRFDARWLSDFDNMELKHMETFFASEYHAKAVKRLKRAIADLQREIGDWYGEKKYDLRKVKRAVEDGAEQDEIQAIHRALDKMEEIKAQAIVLGQFVKLIHEKHKHYLKVYTEHGRRDPEKGDVWPYDVQQLEKVWHVTTAYKQVLSGGFKTKKQLGDVAGLGGATEGISFTASFDHAQGIMKGIKIVVTLLNSSKRTTIIEYFKRLGVSEDNFKSIAPYYFKPDTPEKLKLDDAYDLIRKGLMAGELSGVVYNPLFIFVDPGKLKDLDPKNIGIIEAIINTKEPGVKYLAAMEEWRVPIPGILSYGPIGSQKKSKLIKKMQRTSSNLRVASKLLDAVKLIVDG